MTTNNNEDEDNDNNKINSSKSQQKNKNSNLEKTIDWTKFYESGFKREPPNSKLDWETKINWENGFSFLTEIEKRLLYSCGVIKQCHWVDLEIEKF